jgi:hypothetical protein
MIRWITLAIRASLVLTSVWFAFMLPSWLDSSFYDLCPSFNCFASLQSFWASLALGLGVGIVLNLLFTIWTRSRLPSAVDDP